MTTTTEEFQEDDAFSDDEIGMETHHKLLNAVSRLYKKQRIEAPKRSEPVQEISEFNLSSGIEGKTTGQTVNVFELLGDLKERVTHRDITNKVKSAQKRAKKLPKPLEKIEEQKITRIVGYENVKKQFNKWSSIVERNKLATQLTFPLEQNKKTKHSYKFLTTFKEPTELEKEMAKVLNQSEIGKEEIKKEKKLSKLSIEEMIERRNMTAKMRARESYRISKAVRNNKIKSKKYHRILKKEKIKQELKDFEKLQKTDPEAALEKLEQIERARAEERISLRHRNTGKWARSKAIRAKYDTEARIELAEQLAKSRELTRKLKENENSSSGNETEDEHSEDEHFRIANISKDSDKSSGNNPWVSDYKNFVSGYKNFSSRNIQRGKKDHSDNIEVNENEKETIKNTPVSISGDSEDIVVNENGKETIKNTTVSISGDSEDTVDIENNKDIIENMNMSVSGEPNRENSDVNKSTTQSLNKNEKPPTKSLGTERIKNIEEPLELSGSKNFVVSVSEKEGKYSSVSLSDEEEVIFDKLNASVNNNNKGNSMSHKNSSINEIFEEVEDVLQNHAALNVEKLKANLNLDDDDDNVDENEMSEKNQSKRFEFKQLTRLHDIDAALIEVTEEGISSGQNDLSYLKEKLNASEHKKETEPQIDPNKLINVKPQKLSSELPDFDENGDDSEDEKQKHLNLMEAFAEDDIVDQFRQEKKEEEKSGKPKEINLEMPGWGSWGGTDIKLKSKRKTRRFIVKFPKLRRKDQKKPNVIINDDPVPKLREQLVNELPYPFTSVRDFEASIRAPIGKHWVTEKGFKKLTAPSVITKMGTVIEPMSNSMLINKSKKNINNNKPDVKFKKRKIQ